MNVLPMTIVLDKQHRVAHIWAHEIIQADLTTVVLPLLKEIEPALGVLGGAAEQDQPGHKSFCGRRAIRASSRASVRT